MKKKKGKYPRFSGEDDQATKPDIRRRKKPEKPTHAHDDFEIEIEVETEITEVDQPLYTGESVITDKLPVPVEHETITQAAETDRSDLDLELPKSSGEEVLPVYVSSKKSLKPAPKQNQPPPRPFPKTPIPTPDKQDVLSLFDDPENASLSTELPPIHELPSATPDRPDSKPPTSPPPPSSVEEFEILRPGETTGVQPLDGDLFEARSAPRKKKKHLPISPTAPLPMAHSEQIVQRRYKFTLRDLILLLLALILAAALVLAWFIYKDYRDEMELKEFDRGRELIEKTKTEAIQDTAPEKVKDIPYKSKIETPQGESSGKKK